MSEKGDLEDMQSEIEELKNEIEDAKDELEDQDGCCGKLDGCTKKMEGIFWEGTKYAICILFILLGFGTAGFGFYGLWIDEEKVYLEMAEEFSSTFGLDSVRTKFNWFLFIVGLTPIVPCLLSFITRILSNFDRFKYCSLVMPTLVLQLTLGLYLLAPLLILIVALFDKIFCIMWTNATNFFVEIFKAILPAILDFFLNTIIGDLMQRFLKLIPGLG